MKRAVMVVLVWTTLLGSVCFGQQVVERTLEWHKSQPVDLNLKFGDDIKVTGWNRNQVSVKATVRINDDLLDSLFSMQVNQGQTLEVTADIRRKDLRGIRMYGCEDTRNKISMNGHSVLCSEIHYDVKIPFEANLRLSSISANEIIRNIRGPVRAKSISGFVDMDWSKKRGADMEVKTISGEAYSDLDNIVWANRKHGIPQVGYLLRGTLAGGGPLIHLESISNDIYLRERK